MWRGLQGGINFYWRIVGMSNYYGNATDLTGCIEEKLRNFLGYSIRSSYPDRGGEYDVAREYAEGQCRMELGLGPRNPRDQHSKRRRLTEEEANNMKRYMAELIAAQRKEYRGTYNSRGRDLTLPPVGAQRPPKPPKISRYTDAVSAFPDLGGGRRTRRRRTTKKRTRKQRR